MTHPEDGRPDAGAPEHDAAETAELGTGVPSAARSVPAGPVPADPVPAGPVPAEPVPAEPVPAEPVPAEPISAEPSVPEPSSDGPPPEPATAALPLPTAPGNAPAEDVGTGSSATPHHAAAVQGPFVVEPAAPLPEPAEPAAPLPPPSAPAGTPPADIAPAGIAPAGTPPADAEPASAATLSAGEASLPAADADAPRMIVADAPSSAVTSAPLVSPPSQATLPDSAGVEPVTAAAGPELAPELPGAAGGPPAEPLADAPHTPSGSVAASATAGAATAASALADPHAHAHVPGSNGDDGVTADDSARRRVELPVALTALLALLLLATVAFLGYQLRQQQLTETARDQATAASREAARLLFSYDYAKLDEDFAKGLATTTGKFTEEYSRTTKEVVAPVAKEYKAVVVADVVESAVIRAQPDQVTALVFLNQATTSTRVTGQQVDQSRVRMTLVKRGDRWLVSEVKAL